MHVVSFILFWVWVPEPAFWMIKIHELPMRSFYSAVTQKKCLLLGLILLEVTWPFAKVCHIMAFHWILLYCQILGVWCDKISASYLLTSMWRQKALSSISGIDSNWYLVYTSFVIFKSQKQLNCTLSQRWIVFRGRSISSNTQNFSNASLK